MATLLLTFGNQFASRDYHLAAGYVSPTTAPIMGIAAGVVCYFAVALKNRLRWDDALDVWGVHGVGGALGIVLLGVFASSAVNLKGIDGLIGGNVAFLAKQIAAIAISSIWAFVFTYGMLWAIDRITPVKVKKEAEEAGLDSILHGETAYLT